MKRLDVFFALYITAVLALLVYSFTQVDLGLTLSRLPLWQDIQKIFQNIGYFDRPLSTSIYLTIASLLFIAYCSFLILVKRGVLNRRQVWRVIIFTGVVLTFSYSAFSYDLFNYIFDAKIVTYYHQNPYEHKALDYPNDPMLGFMHWTHRTYPYGPVWLFITVPLSYIGLHFFLPTLILFKILMTLAFLGTAMLLEKILIKLKTAYSLLGLVFFSLNPLVILESIVSAHNDLVMIFFLLWSIYVLIDKKYVRSILLFIFSVGVKFATIFALPTFLVFYPFGFRKKAVNWDRIFFALTLVMILPVVFASIRTNFQPWYLLYVIPFASLVVNRYYIVIPILTFTISGLLFYVPYLYYGNWNDPIPTTLSLFLFFTLVFALVGICLFSIRQRQLVK